MVDIGEAVVAGQVIAVLTDHQLEIELEEKKGEIAQLKDELRSLEHARSGFQERHYEVATKTEQLVSAVEDLTQLQEKAELLILRAPRDGNVIAPTYRPEPIAMENELGRWYGTPFDNQNENCLLESGTTFCYVGTNADLELAMFVAQDSVNKVRPDLPVRLKLAAFPHTTLDTVVRDIAQLPIDSVPAELAVSNGGSIPVAPDRATFRKPMFTYYQVSAAIPEFVNSPHPGFRGWAKIQIERGSLYTRAIRYFNHVFNFG